MLKNKNKLWLYLGCGHHRLKGFAHVEVNAGKNKSGLPDIIADITEHIPLPDDSAELIFSRATMEHLTYPELINCLLESHRLLQRGGVVRIVVPDLDKYVQDYLNKVYDPTLKELHGMPNENYADTFVARIMYFDHKYNHTFDTMKGALERAGFQEVRRGKPGDSKIEKANEELFVAEKGRDSDIIIEAVKGENAPTVSRSPKKYPENPIARLLARFFNLKVVAFNHRQAYFPQRYWWLERWIRIRQTLNKFL
jgi:predicted SAM-dependent methyltransferase